MVEIGEEIDKIHIIWYQLIKQRHVVFFWRSCAAPEMAYSSAAHDNQILTTIDRNEQIPNGNIIQRRGQCQLQQHLSLHRCQ